MKAEAHGWSPENGTYKIKWYDGDQLPQGVLEILNDGNTSTSEEVDIDQAAYDSSDESDYEDDEYIYLCLGSKNAEVTPIFKKKDRLCKENYRPVSVVPIMSKAFEQILSAQLMNYFKDIFDDMLSAYRKKYSCQSVLLKLTETWKHALDNKMYVGTVMADLSRAFDSMPHKLLVCKLHAYGLSIDSCKMIASYLKDRQQRVKIGEYRSEWKIVSKGFPQGSGLGPLLYNIFSNDLFYFMAMCDLFNYADDNTMTCNGSSSEEVMYKLKNDVTIVIDWFERNLMKANPDKFTVMFLTPTRAVDDFPEYLLVNDVSIARKNVTKLLGVVLDDKLLYNKHIEQLCAKASRQLNALIRIRRYLEKGERYITVSLYQISIFVL